jgi:hypothetical protein
MIAALLAALGSLATALLPLLVKWLVRRWAAHPLDELTRQRQENGQAVAGADPNALNELLEELLNRVEGREARRE